MISIIIVGYNSLKDLPQCFESIYASTHKDFNIIFINNTPWDDCNQFIKKNYTKTIIVPNSSNIGFAAANNLGIKKAIEIKSDYVFLLNPDTVIDNKCIEELIQNKNQNLILQPLVLVHKNSAKTNLVNTTGSYLNFLGISYCNDYNKSQNQVTNKDIPLASGAAMFFPTKLYQQIGGFDESFFIYDEDMDLSWRARKFDYNIKLITSAIVWHKYSFSRNKDKYYYIEKNRLSFLLKNFSIKYLTLIFPAFIINEILMILFATINGWLGYKLQSYLYIFKNIKNIFNQRSKIQNKIPESKLNIYISSEINYSEIKSWLFTPYNIFLYIYWRLIKPLL